MPTITTAYLGDQLFATDLGRHHLVVDVPAAFGGKDRGPSAPDLFIAALGSCVAIFVASYCEKAGLDARDLAVNVSFDKAEKPSRLVNLRITISLPHVEPGDREQAIRRVAEHCTVHETIRSLTGIDFEIEGRAQLAA
jgi:putative redox protein